MAVSKKKCKPLKFQNGKATRAPTYTGIWHPPRLRRKLEDFFFFSFFAYDIERCVKSL